MTELSLRLGLLCDGLPGRHDVLGNRAAAGEDLRHGGARNTKRPRDGERLTLGWHGDYRNFQQLGFGVAPGARAIANKWLLLDWREAAIGGAMDART